MSPTPRKHPSRNKTSRNQTPMHSFSFFHRFPLTPLLRVLLLLMPLYLFLPSSPAKAGDLGGFGIEIGTTDENLQTWGSSSGYIEPEQQEVPQESTPYIPEEPLMQESPFQEVSSQDSFIETVPTSAAPVTYDSPSSSFPASYQYTEPYVQEQPSASSVIYEQSPQTQAQPALVLPGSSQGGQEGGFTSSFVSSLAEDTPPSTASYPYTPAPSPTQMPLSYESQGSILAPSLTPTKAPTPTPLPTKALEPPRFTPQKAYPGAVLVEGDGSLCILSYQLDGKEAPYTWKGSLLLPLTPPPSDKAVPLNLAVIWEGKEILTERLLLTP